MECDWVDGLALKAESLLRAADEGHGHDIAAETDAAWSVRKVANLMGAGYTVSASPRLQRALAGFVTEELDE